jgi:hypothetical protein
MEMRRTETPALTRSAELRAEAAISPRRGRKIRRHEASSDRGFSTVSGFLNLANPPGQWSAVSGMMGLRDSGLTEAV